MKFIRLLVLFFAPLVAFAAPDFKRFAFTLEIKEGTEISRSGTGCLVRSGTATYYVTANHIFGEMTDQERAAHLKNFTVVSESSGAVRFFPAEFIRVPGVKNLSKTDLMVFKMKPNPTMAKYEVVLAPAAPVQDEVVYLSASLPGKPLTTYALKILAVSDEIVNYEKIPGVLKYTGASGGPILNEKGQLVGTYTGRSLVEANKPEIRHLIGTPYQSLSAILSPTAQK